MNKFYARHRHFILLWLALLIVAGGSGFLAYFNPSEISQITNYPISQTGATTVVREDAKEKSNSEDIPIPEKLRAKKELNLSAPNPQPGSTSTEISDAENIEEIPLASNNSQEIAPFTLVVGDQSIEAVFAPNTTVYQAMSKFAAEGRITFQTIDYPGIGKFVNEINGIKNDQKKGIYWIYYLNGVSAKIGVSQSVLKPNDVITWKYEKSKF